VRELRAECVHEHREARQPRGVVQARATHGKVLTDLVTEGLSCGEADLDRGAAGFDDLHVGLLEEETGRRDSATQTSWRAIGWRDD